MEIILENKTIPSYKEVFHQIKRIQESTDSVVPDINDDIGKIANIQSSCFLKSKDVVSEGVSVTGEVCVSILYITENEDSVAHIKLKKSFSMLFETVETVTDSEAQINLQISNIEARVINPRKVSVTFEICGELSCYISELIDEQCAVPEEYEKDLKLKQESIELVIPNAVCEKTFAINEQYIFPSGKAEPNQLVSQKVDLNVSDTQHVGSKLIVKGNVNVSVCYMSKDVSYPVFTQFISGFSQIIDTGAESMDNCSVQIELSSCYFDLIETISSEHALDMELHAVIQIVSRKKQQIKFFSDVYSNLMPVNNKYQSKTLCDVSPMQQDKISINEKLNVAAECEDILCVVPAINQIGIIDSKLSASICFDIIYKNKSGNISSVRRIINTESDKLLPGARLLSFRLSNINISPDECVVDARCTLEYTYQVLNSIEYSKVCSVEMLEDKSYDPASFPSITIVRLDKDKLWELAKEYHSSVEIIKEKNDIESLNGSFIMIPKE